MKTKLKTLFTAILLASNMPSLCQEPPHSKMKFPHRYSEDLSKVLKEQQSLSKKSIPKLKGWFTQERKAFLEAIHEIKKLIITHKIALIKVKISLEKAKKYPLQLIRALTSLAYTMCAAIVIFVAIHIRANLF